MQPLAPDDPSHVGPYRLLGRLGAGGMGRVYLARPADEDGAADAGRATSTVALKLVRPEIAQQVTFRRRFAREVRAARRVGGRWTAPVLDADTEADVPWVASAYVPGPTLSAVVSGEFGPLPSASAHILAHRMGIALRAIHDAGLVHRDLKPSNVLLTTDGPRVIDFGVAHLLDASADSTLTPAGSLIGSPEFMSPEQVRGGRVVPASDVFSLGCVLTYAATGQSPFGPGDRGVHALLFRIAYEEPELGALPEALIDLVQECLAKDPAERPSVDEVIHRTRLAPSGAWLPPPLLVRLDRASAHPIPNVPRRLASSEPRPADTGVHAVFPELPEPAGRIDPLDIPEAGITPPRIRPVPQTRVQSWRRAVVVTLALAALAGLGFGADAAVRAVVGGRTPAADGSKFGHRPTDYDHPADGAELPGEELKDEPAGLEFGGSFRLLLDESDPLFMVRLDIPPSAKAGDRGVTFIVGRSGTLCSGTARVTSRKRNLLTVGDARVRKATPGVFIEHECLPPHITLRTEPEDAMSWVVSNSLAVQVDRADGPTSSVPETFVGAWHNGDERVTIRRGRIGETVITGSGMRRGQRCGWSATLMDTTDAVAELGPDVLVSAPAVSTTKTCQPPYRAYRFAVRRGELVRWTNAEAGSLRLARAQ